MRGCSGRTTGSSQRQQQVDQLAQPLRARRRCPARCAVHSTYSPGVDARVAQRREVRLARAAGTSSTRRPSRRRRSTTRPATASRARLSTRGLRRHEQQVDEVVGQHAVELLGHRAVERPHPGLDVHDRDVAPAPPPARRRASSSCRRRRARRPAPRSASSGPSAASMRAVCSVFVPPAMCSWCSGRGTCSSSKKIALELVVVVLAGVDEHLVVALAQQARDGRRLDELRAVADDRDDLHSRRRAARRRRARRTPAAAAAVSGPGAPGSATSSIARDRLDLARRRGQERLARAARARRA